MVVMTSATYIFLLASNPSSPISVWILVFDRSLVSAASAASRTTRMTKDNFFQCSSNPSKIGSLS